MLASSTGMCQNPYPKRKLQAEAKWMHCTELEPEAGILNTKQGARGNDSGREFNGSGKIF